MLWAFPTMAMSCTKNATDTNSATHDPRNKCALLAVVATTRGRMGRMASRRSTARNHTSPPTVRQHKRDGNDAVCTGAGVLLLLTGVTRIGQGCRDLITGNATRVESDDHLFGIGARRDAFDAIHGSNRSLDRRHAMIA